MKLLKYMHSIMLWANIYASTGFLGKIQVLGLESLVSSPGIFFLSASCWFFAIDILGTEQEMKEYEEDRMKYIITPKPVFETIFFKTASVYCAVWLRDLGNTSGKRTKAHELWLRLRYNSVL